MGTPQPRFEDVFRRATDGLEPFPFQRRLAARRWPDLLHVPTGLGKTAAVGLAWIHGRLVGDPGTPRRLVYCLPMRVLVEQTATEFRGWLERLGLLGEPGEPNRTAVSVLMGGESDLRSAPWARNPEQPQVLIGTQDMLLSRALMRGYGMSRYQWPIHFGLLHTDALWVFDEVQLMGPGLPTSAQLEAFRRHASGTASHPDQPHPRPARSLWVSATLRPEWLGTVDFAPHLPELLVQRVDEEDRRAARRRLQAPKRLAFSGLRLDREGRKSSAKFYLDGLAGLVEERHVSGSQTLVILNRVDRAQEVAMRLRKSEAADSVILVHSRFREAERVALNAELRDSTPENRIIVATQAVEAGVDVSSRTMVTELAPWDSLVQRFGRCNRRGEHGAGADILWVDVESGIGESAPYEDEDLDAAREILETLESASPGDLPEIEGPRRSGPVLRRRDLIDLFDTDPDLSGFDVDVSPYIRDPGSPQVQVFWREFDNAPSEDAPPPHRAELCSYSMGHIREYLKKTRKGRTRPAWRRDSLAGRWVAVRDGGKVRPGMTLMLQAGAGGYDPVFGVDPGGQAPVPVLAPPDDVSDDYDGDRQSRQRRFVTLREHTEGVVRVVREVVEELDPAGLAALATAARWHDVGKAHAAFQTALLDAPDPPPNPERGPWAKSSGQGRLKYRLESSDGVERRRHFRHELASMLAWLEHGEGEARDLIAYLILSHHGRVRMSIRALPTEPRPSDDRLFARGVHDGDRLPSADLGGLQVPETDLDLDLMQMGLGLSGPSWSERSRSLLAEMGPFRLAWLESLLRIADWRASAREEA
jgi:CRISPR-associated endonuclease/helicase Cas3